MEPKKLSIPEFIRESNILEHTYPPPPNISTHRIPGIVQPRKEYSPLYWYEKLGCDKLEKKYGLPHKILLYIIDIESKGDPYAVSKLGAQGLFQIMPYKYSGFKGNPLNPYESAEWVAQTLGTTFRKLGNIEKTLAAYNWGITNVMKHGLAKIPSHTKEYLNFFKSVGIITPPLEHYSDDSWGEEDITNNQS